ncbi:transposase [Cohnella pontilimi]|uniref:Transposase n=1 Tax=Cohnella pontilimi TaxID=2564100 RepID=A0A4U0FDP9_9BACL|nr:transposase [Cohnella pontilimi]TJY42384.1 transposase [Cohnella pontilimi]
MKSEQMFATMKPKYSTRLGVVSLYRLMVSFLDFCREYETEEACEQAFFEAKWPDGFRCPRCRASQAYVTRTRRLALYECKTCRHQTSVIAGTVLEGSRTPMKLWLRAIFLHSQSNAMPATQLSQILGVTYKTAWLIGHKLRHATSVADAGHPLTGTVRVNIGVYIRSRHPGFKSKSDMYPLWVGASMNDRQEPEYIKIKTVRQEHLCYMRVLPSGVESFISENIAPGTTDLFCVSHYGSAQKIKALSAAKIEAVAWLKIGFWGGIGPKHLQAYLNQFCFNRNVTNRKSSIFDVLFQLCAKTRTLIYPVLIGKRQASTPTRRRPRLRPAALERVG